MKQVKLLERTESDSQKTLYEWNEHGHLTAVLFYIKASNGEWTLDQGTDWDYSRRYTYEYNSDHTCSRQSVYSVDDNAVANMEIERVVASTNAEGIYLEQYYKYDNDAGKLLLSEEFGYDRFGNEVINRWYTNNGTGTPVCQGGYYRRFSQNVTDEYGNLIADYYSYMTMKLTYQGYDYILGHESMSGYKQDVTETSNSWTFTNYEWSNESQQFEVRDFREYVWNDSHDRIVRYRNANGTDEYITTMTYDALKRLVKKECSKTGSTKTTSTYTYASQVVFDPTNPVYTEFDSNHEKLPDDIHLAMEAVENASYSTFGPVAQFTDYYDEVGRNYTVGTATFEDSRYYKHVSIVEYDMEEGNIREEKGEIDYYHLADGRPNYYVALFTWTKDGETNSSQEKYEWNYNVAGRLMGHTWYDWNEQTKSWSIDEIVIKEYDDAGNCLQVGFKYISEKNGDINGDGIINEQDVKWYGDLTVYHYDASGNCTGSDYYVANSTTGEWELQSEGEESSSDDPYVKRYEENGFRITETHYPGSTPVKECVFIQPSRPLLQPIDFLADYKSLALDGDDYDVIGEAPGYKEVYKLQDGKWVLVSAYGTKTYWTDNKTCVCCFYYKQIGLDRKDIYEVDDLNRVTHYQHQDIDPSSGSVHSSFTYTYTYLDDTRYLTENVYCDSDNNTSTTKYYYAAHQVIDDIASPIASSSPLFTCEGRSVKSSSPMTVYSLSGQCIAKDTKQLTLSQSGIYLIKIGSAAQKVYIK